MTDNIPDHFTISMGVNCSRVDFIESKEMFVKYFEIGLCDSKLALLEIEHLGGGNKLHLFFKFNNAEQGFK